MAALRANNASAVPLAHTSAAEGAAVPGLEPVNNATSWPLSFRLRGTISTTWLASAQQKRWWSHKLYRGPDDKPVVVLYSKTKNESEKLAKKFLNEPVLGFDMEWPWDSHKKHRLQDKVGLIQLACEDKVGLFHIGLHPGQTSEELIAPTLRKIIESADISKLGVAVLNADMARLVNFFGLRPRGAFELSHLHRLVTFGGRKPEEATTKLVKLATLVETHLGLPLSKGAVRTSNWSRPLNETQKEYAAADAYAGYMLYHRLNAKRLAMNPVPPLPIHAEIYLPLRMPPIRPLRLQSTHPSSAFTDVKEFYLGYSADAAKPLDNLKTDELGFVDIDDIALSTSKKDETPIRTSNPRGTETDSRAKSVTVERNGCNASMTATEPIQSLDPVSQRLFTDLSNRRRSIATAQSLPCWRIAHNHVLEALAKERPLDEAGLLRVKGIGAVALERYGADWLDVIRSFSASNDMAPPCEGENGRGGGGDIKAETDNCQAPATPSRCSRRVKRSTNRSSSPAFGTPLNRAPLLHTGISFSMADATLGKADCTDTANVRSTDESEEFATSRCRPSPPLKRKRSVENTQFQSPFPAVTNGTTGKRSRDPKTQIFRSKLDAYCKRIASMLAPRPSQPLLSSSALDTIVQNPPTTSEELRQIDGIETLAAACAALDKDLLGIIAKFAAA